MLFRRYGVWKGEILGKYIIEPFSGEGDIMPWIKKVKLVAKLQKVSDHASFLLPLFFCKEMCLSFTLKMRDNDHLDGE